jgi:hypothetical protein
VQLITLIATLTDVENLGYPRGNIHGMHEYFLVLGHTQDFVPSRDLHTTTS